MEEEDPDDIIAQERKRTRRLTRYELELALENASDEAVEQIKALLPPAPDDEGRTLFIDAEQQAQLLAPGDYFSAYEVWITSGERGASNLAQQINATGERARVVPQSIMVAGDIWIVFRGAVVLEIVERKSILDALASIMDGRYQDQPPRLIASGVRFIYWMIVGTTSMIGNTEHRQAVHTGLSRLSHDYTNLNVIQISDEQMVAETMRAHCISVRAHFGECERVTQLPTVNFIKRTCGVKQLDTQEAVWLVWMCTPLRVGPAAAKAVVAQYPSISSYLSGVRACRTEKEASLLLSKIQIPKINGVGSKSFGKVLSARVLECVLTADERRMLWGPAAS